MFPDQEVVDLSYTTLIDDASGWFVDNISILFTLHQI